MFSFSVMQSPFRFSNVEILAVPTKWDQFEILAKGRSDTHDTVSSEKLYLY